jgi:hypothetical protein
MGIQSRQVGGEEIKAKKTQTYKFAKLTILFLTTACFKHHFGLNAHNC